jgi:Cu/Ag efflux protein CusF
MSKAMFSFRLRGRVGTLVLVAITLLTMSACGREVPKQQVTHTGKGIVLGVDPAKSRVKINHEKMEGYMDAMTMWFNVSNASLLNGIAEGDSVEFTVTEEASADVVTAIRKTAAAQPGPG